MKEYNQTKVAIFPSGEWCYLCEVDQAMRNYGKGDDFLVLEEEKFMKDAVLQYHSLPTHRDYIGE